MKRATLAAVAVAIITLAACGDPEITATVTKASGKPSTTTVPETTEPEQADSLADVHEQCTGAATVQEFSERHNDVGRIYRDILTKEDEIVGVLAELYDPEEDTLTLPGAYGEGEEDYGPTPLHILVGIVTTCVLRNLDVPTRVIEHMDTTRALDGMQTDSWDDYQARWTFHPEDGMNITIWTES